MKKNNYLIKILIVILTFSGCQLYKDDADGKKKSGDPSDGGIIAGSGNLIITEIGAVPYYNYPVWIEIYNKSAEPAILSNYKLRARSRNSSNYSILDESRIFDLPNVIIQPGAYFIIRNKVIAYLPDSSQIIYLKDSSGYVPGWDENGFVELLINGVTADFVRFGAENTDPVTLTEWGGSAASALPYSNVQASGKSIARDAVNTDNDSFNDWVFKEFATAGGPNDITSFDDNDADGIPDQCEASGKTFAGLPLYEWGARVNQKDIFIHLDYMDSNDPGVKPRKEALDEVCRVFQDRDYYVHFDAGGLYGNGINNYNLDKRDHLVPFADGINFSGSAGCANFFWYKNNYMPIAKKNIFYYCVMGYSQQADGTGGSSGLGELNGNDFILTCGNLGLNAESQENLNRLYHHQAATIMHELGHNFGLRHGGNNDLNYKPNYYSVMNYMYELRGLSDIGNNNGDRYYYSRYVKFDLMADASLFKKYFTSADPDIQLLMKELKKNPYTDSFKMDYSDGLCGTIDENSINESIGINFPGSSPIDYNGNGVLNESGYSFDLNNDGALNVFNDYNDWANIKIYFYNTISGYSSGQSKSFISYDIEIWQGITGNDREPVINDCH